MKKGQSRETGSIGYTKHRTKTIQGNWLHWVHKTQNKDNPGKLAALGTQDTEQRQSRETGSIGYTRHRTKTIQGNWQHWVHKTQNRSEELV
jgi:hypothetical protein